MYDTEILTEGKKYKLVCLRRGKRRYTEIERARRKKENIFEPDFAQKGMAKTIMTTYYTVIHALKAKSANNGRRTCYSNALVENKSR